MILVDDTRAALGPAASLVYGEPSRSVRVVAVTGTNGKTTIVELVRCMLERAGHAPATLGTLGVRFRGDAALQELHVPEADGTNRLLARLRDSGATHLVLEATSHALAQKRLDGLRIAVGAFTNLTHDHLDLHGTLDAYGRAKARLFRELGPTVSVIDVDDPFGASLAGELGGACLRVSCERPADLAVTRSSCDATGIRAEVLTPSGEVSLRAPLIGRHNLSNLLCALGVAVGLKLDMAVAVEALSTCLPPPGRLERCDGPEDDIVTLVDYAHSPDALEKALDAARLLGRGRLFCVFGCGGDRDRDKRAPMGEVAARHADALVITSDNPRTEPPLSIAHAVASGARGAGKEATIELDRGSAITHAVGLAAPGDIVLVAGKGHETEQVLGRERRLFDDRVEVRRALARRRGTTDEG